MAAKVPTHRAPFDGALVIYVDAHMGDTYPAIVTRVSAAPPQVMLTAFQPGATPFPIRGLVPFDPAAPPARGTWHWPKEI
jgi:hypothetical protein